MDLIIEGPFNVRFTGPMNYDKWYALEKRLRAVEGNDLFDHIRVVKACLVLNIVVPKEFKVLDFIKYTRLEFLNTHL
jgi:hypothetical protein